LVSDCMALHLKLNLVEHTLCSLFSSRHPLHYFYCHIYTFMTSSLCSKHSRPLSRPLIIHGYPTFKTAKFLESGRDDGHLAPLALPLLPPSAPALPVSASLHCSCLSQPPYMYVVHCTLLVLPCLPTLLMSFSTSLHSLSSPASLHCSCLSLPPDNAHFCIKGWCLVLQ
jgi:hypothetical protein